MKPYNKRQLALMSNFFELDSVDLESVEHPVLADIPREPYSPNPLLDAIYAPDPVTRLPKGDIACYLGKDTNKEIRDYIEANLFTEHPSTPAIPVDKSDALFDYIREVGETPQDYARRITEFERNRLKNLKHD